MNTSNTNQFSTTMNRVPTFGFGKIKKSAKTTASDEQEQKVLDDYIMKLNKAPKKPKTKKITKEKEILEEKYLEDINANELLAKKYLEDMEANALRVQKENEEKRLLKETLAKKKALVKQNAKLDAKTAKKEIKRLKAIRDEKTMTVPITKSISDESDFLEDFEEEIQEPLNFDFGKEEASVSTNPLAFTNEKRILQMPSYLFGGDTDSTPFKNANTRDYYVHVEHLKISTTKQKDYELQQRVNSINTCRVKTSFDPVKARLLMIAEMPEKINIDQGKVDMVNFLLKNLSSVFENNKSILDSWELIEKAVKQTKFNLEEILKNSENMIPKLPNVMLFLRSVKTIVKNSSKAKATNQVQRIRAEVIETLDTKVIESDKNQQEILKRTVKTMKTLCQVGCHTKQLSSEEKITRALVSMWTELSDDNMELKKNIFVEIYDRIGIQKIIDMSGSTGSSLRKFHNKFNDIDRIKFCFQNRSDVMEPFSPLVNTKHRLESFQVQGVEYIEQGLSIVVGAPTSSGKTFLTLYCIDDEKDVLFIYPTAELAKQAAGSIRNRSNEHGAFTPITYICGLEVIKDVNSRITIGTPIDVLNYYMLEQSRQTLETCDEIIEQFDTFGTPEHVTYTYVRTTSIANFDTVVVDEFQQINNISKDNETDQGKAMQQIMQLNSQAQFIVLSATIRNIEQVVDWIKYLSGKDDVRSVEYNERFINQERWCYTGDKIEKASCLSVVTVKMIAEGCLTRSEMQFPSTQLPDLGSTIYDKTKNELALSHVFFANDKVTLKSCKKYEDLLKNLMTSLSKNDSASMQNILDLYRTTPVSIDKLGIPELYKVLMDLKKRDMLKAMVFIFDQYLCKKTCYELLDYMLSEEARRFPLWIELRELQNERYEVLCEEKAKLLAKKSVSSSDNKSEDGAKVDAENRAESIMSSHLQIFIKMSQSKIDHAIDIWSTDFTPTNVERIATYTKERARISCLVDLHPVNEFAPHPQYTFAKFTVTQDMMREMKRMLNPTHLVSIGKIGNYDKKKRVPVNDKYRPPIQYNGKYMSCAERGFTFYTKYLREIDSRFQGTAQTMLEKYGIQVMFSDASYAVGVNLPVTTVMFYNPSFSEIGMMEIPVILAHQAQGRGARRGLDTKGFVIYMGVEHKSLMLGEYLDITGHDIIGDYVTLPVMFNSKFPVKRLSQLSMSQFAQVSNMKDVILIDEIAKVEQNNCKRLHDDIRFCYANVTHRPMQMHRLLQMTKYANVIQDFFNYTTEKSYRETLVFKDFDIVSALMNMLFPDIIESDDEYKISDVIDKLTKSFLVKCKNLNKSYRFGKYSGIASDVRMNMVENISLTKLDHLKFLSEILDILCSSNTYVTSGWKDAITACHIVVSNLVFAMCIR